MQYIRLASMTHLLFRVSVIISLWHIFPFPYEAPAELHKDTAENPSLTSLFFYVSDLLNRTALLMS